MKKLIFFVFLLLLVSCDTERDYLKIGTNVWPGYEPLYVARELGYLKGIPVHIVEYGSASQVIRAYRNRLINSAALTLDEVILLKSYGFDPVVVLVMDVSNGADAIVARKGIETLSDLKGKKVGVENSALGAYMLLRALEKAGLSLKDIRIVSIEVNEHYRWFKEGKVDAVVTFEPVKSKLTKIGGKVIFDSSQIPGEIVDVLVVERDYLDKHPQIVKKVVDGWFKAVKKLNENDVKKIISQREKISMSDLERAYTGLKIPDRKENIVMLSKEQAKLLSVAVKLLHIMQEKKIITRRVDVTDMFDGRFVR
ncbi:MAG: ABC transporter substrate-binding protein [Persephonella sp.]|nr:ABC transporter substrate-binding protein [Persephonella sp.]